MFIKDTINYNVVHRFDLIVDGCEEKWVKINLNNIKKIIGVVYRHSNSRVSDFPKSLKTTRENLNEPKPKYFIWGDINIDLLQSSTKVQVKSYSMLFSLGCLPFITYLTRVTSNSAMSIDHLYTNNMPHQATFFIILDDISDYMPILMLSSNTKYKSKESNIYIRDTKNFNAENFLIELTKYHNIQYEVNLSINDQFNRFIKVFSVT